MVCIYCGSETKVFNSRQQKRVNSVWRRRRCQSCQAVFTSIEQPEYTHSLLVHKGGSQNEAFSRDVLFVSIYDSCRHRSDCVADASAITATVIAKLTKQVTHGTIALADIRKTTASTLARFDHVAHTHYTAFHPEQTDSSS